MPSTQSSKNIKFRVTLAFGVVMLVSFTLAIFSYIALMRLQMEARWVNHTNEVLSEANILQVTITSAETAERGFMLTANEAYLSHYGADTKLADTKVKSLEKLCSNNPSQLQRLLRLDSLVDQKFQFMDVMIKASRAPDSQQSAYQLFTSGKGVRIMDAIKASIDSLQTEERNLLGQRRSRAEKSIDNAALYILLGSLLSFLVSAMAVFFFQRDYQQRLRLQNELIQNQNDLYKSQAIARTGTFSIRLDTNQAKWSPELYKVLNFNPDNGEISLPAFYGIIAPQSRSYVELSIAELMRSGGKFHLECQIYAGTAAQKWIVGDISVEKIAENDLGILLGSITDVSERRKAEAKAQRNATLLAGVFETSISGIMAFESIRNATGQIVDFRWIAANQKACDIVSTPKDTLLSTTLLTYMPGNKEAGLFDAYIHVVETSEVFTTEVDITLFGDLRSFQLVATKLADGFAVTFNDTTVQKRNADGLAKNEANLKALIENTDDSIWSIDSNFTITTLNPVFEGDRKSVV